MYAFLLLVALRKKEGIKEALKQMVQTTIFEVEQYGTVKGCLLMNSGKECYQKHPALSHQISIEFEAIYQFITSLIETAQHNQEITNQMKANKIAMRYLTIYNGIIMMLQAGARIDEVQESLNMIDEILK